MGSLISSCYISLYLFVCQIHSTVPVWCEVTHRFLSDHFSLLRNMSGHLRITFLYSEICQVIWGSLFSTQKYVRSFDITFLRLLYSLLLEVDSKGWIYTWLLRLKVMVEITYKQNKSGHFSICHSVLLSAVNQKILTGFVKNANSLHLDYSIENTCTAVKNSMVATLVLGTTSCLSYKTCTTFGV